MTPDELRRAYEQRRRAVEESRAVAERAAAENREMTAEETETYERGMADVDRLGTLITAELDQRDAAARNAELEARVERALAEPGQPQAGGLEADIRAFLAGERRSVEIRPGRPYSTRDFRSLYAEHRDLTVGTASAGGDTVPRDFYRSLMAHLIEVSGIMQTGPTVLTTEGGNPLDVPKTTAHPTAAAVTEGNAIGESDPAFSKVTLSAYKYGVLVQVSSELVADTGVDLLGYLSTACGRALGNATGAKFVVGSGSNEPKGAATAATVGKTGSTGVTGAFGADDLIDLFFSVISPYRSSPSCAWLMRDATLAQVRKLKDTTDQYLWQPSLQVGAPDLLLGKPVYTDPNVAATGLSALSVLFGDFSQYFIRQAGPIRFERSDDYAFNADLVSFRALIRVDGNLVDTTGAVKSFKGGGS